MISIICVIRTIVLIFIVICTFRPMCPPAFFRYFFSDSGIIGYPRGLNKGSGSKFRQGSRLQEGSRVQREIPEEGRRSHRPKRTDNNEDKDNSPNNADNTNHQASSQTFTDTQRRLISWLDFTACQPLLGYFMPKTFLFYSFLLRIQILFFKLIFLSI